MVTHSIYTHSGFQIFSWKTCKQEKTVFIELDNINKLWKFSKLIIVFSKKISFDMLIVLIRVISYRNS